MAMGMERNMVMAMENDTAMATERRNKFFRTSISAYRFLNL